MSQGARLPHDGDAATVATVDLVGLGPRGTTTVNVIPNSWRQH